MVRIKACWVLVFSLAVAGQSRINGGRTIEGPVNYCADAGSTDTYACSMSPALASYQTGAVYQFKANTANTGAATINFNSLGAKTIKKVAGGITTDLADNDIRSGQVVTLTYDGTNMQMQSLLGNAGGGGGGSSLTYGTYSSLPGTCTSGDRYLTSDSPYEFACTATNTWTAFYLGQKCTLPPTSGWSWVNQGTSTISSTGGYLLLTGQLSTAENNRLYVRSVSAPYSKIFRISVSNTTGNAGLLFRESSSGKFIAITFAATGNLGVHAYNTVTTFSTTYVDVHVTHPAMWVKLEDDNTNRIISTSVDGITWQPYLSQTRTTHITADEIGIYTGGNSTERGNQTALYCYE